MPSLPNAYKPRVLYEACPLCDDHNIAHLRTADCSRHAYYQAVVSPLMSWQRCSKCGHVFTDGYFSDEVAKAIYNRTSNQQRPGVDIEKWRPISARMIERV